MNPNAEKYSFDKNVFHAMKVKDADRDVDYWKTKTLSERLDAAWFLIHQFYGTTPQTPLDKSVFSKRKHSHG